MIQKLNLGSVSVMYRPIIRDQLHIVYWYPDGSTLCVGEMRGQAMVQVWLFDNAITKLVNNFIDVDSPFITNMMNITRSELVWTYGRFTSVDVRAWCSDMVVPVSIKLTPYAWYITVPPLKTRREVFAINNRLYSIPVNVRDVFAPPRGLAVQLFMKRIVIVIIMLKKYADTDVVRSVVLLHSELFRKHDYAQYSVQV